MPGLYVSRRGHVGVGFGCIGFFAYIFFWMIAAVVIAGVVALVVAVPVVITLMCALILGVDAMLKAVPAYRRRRADAPLVGPKKAIVGAWGALGGLIPGQMKKRPATAARPTAAAAPSLSETVQQSLVRAGWKGVQPLSGRNVLAGTDRDGRHTLVVVYEEGTPSSQVPLDFVQTFVDYFKTTEFSRAVLVARSKYGVRSVTLANQAKVELAHPDFAF